MTSTIASQLATFARIEMLRCLARDLTSHLFVHIPKMGADGHVERIGATTHHVWLQYPAAIVWDSCPTSVVLELCRSRSGTGGRHVIRMQQFINLVHGQGVAVDEPLELRTIEIT